MASMVEIRVTPPGSSSAIEIPYSSFDLTRYRDPSQSDTFRFESPANAGIVRGMWVDLVDHETVLFRGVVSGLSGSLYEDNIKYDCIHNLALAKLRQTCPLRYGAPPVDTSNYDKLALRYVLSSDPPIQIGDTLADGSVAVATDPELYVMGLVWLMNSLVSPGVESVDSDGIWTIEGLGSGSRGGGSSDVFFAGHKCTNVSTLAAVDDANYQFFRDAGKLCIHGIGAGDEYGPVCVSNAFDSKIRIGVLDRADEYLLNALDLDSEAFWPLIKDFIAANGMYFSYRWHGGYLYLDGSLSVPGRGWADQGFMELSKSDQLLSYQTLPANMPPATAVRAVGAGEGAVADRYARVDFGAGKPWIEELMDQYNYEYLSPLGQLDTLADDKWDEIQREDNVQISTTRLEMNPSDWLTLDLEEDGIKTLQITESRIDEGLVHRMKLGAARTGVQNAYLSTIRSSAVQVYVSGALHGEETTTDTFGNADNFSMNWTSTALNESDRDNARVTFNLTMDSSAEPDETQLAVTYTVTVNGTVVAVIRHAQWGSTNTIVGLDITPGCKLDGTQETLTVAVSDPTGTLSETLSFTGQVIGFGRYGSTPLVIMYPDGDDAPTELDGGWSENKWWTPAGADAWLTSACTMETGTIPAYTIRVVVGATASIARHSNRRETPTDYYIGLKIGGNYYWGTKHTMVIDQVHKTEDVWLVNPDTDAAWNQAAIDALVVVMKIWRNSSVYISGYGFYYYKVYDIVADVR